MGVAAAATVRRRALVVPREHGAWGILLVPLLTGAVTGVRDGGSASGLAPLCIAALALFWVRTPIESWFGASPIRARTPGELRLARNTSFALAGVAAVASAWLLWGGDRWSLLGIGAAAGAALLLQWFVKRTWRGARAAAQVVGAAGLTATGPAAYYVATGRLDGLAWALWAANFLFAGNQIHFVQTRIHAAQTMKRAAKAAAGRWFLAGQVALLVILAAAYAAGVPGRGAAVAFAPALVRGFAWFAASSKPLDVHALGKSELAHAIAFGALLIAAMLWE